MCNKDNQILQFARDLAKGADWVTYFREILGVEGIVRQLFARPQALTRFQQTNEFAEIQGILVCLHQDSRVAAQRTELVRLVTVPMPKAVYEHLHA